MINFKALFFIFLKILFVVLKVLFYCALEIINFSLLLLGSDGTYEEELEKRVRSGEEMGRRRNQERYGDMF